MNENRKSIKGYGCLWSCYFNSVSARSNSWIRRQKEMKEVAKIKEYSLKEFWFSYYVFWKDDDGFEWECCRFENLKDAVDYIMSWLKQEVE